MTFLRDSKMKDNRKNIFVFCCLIFSLSLSSACSERSEGINSSDASDISQIVDDVGVEDADVSRDKGYIYIYEDKPFVQYRSTLIDTDVSVNAVVEYQGRIIAARDDGLFYLKDHTIPTTQ